jgi:hypothetical protein
MAVDGSTRDRVRLMLMSEVDINGAAVEYAREALIDTRDLWWLFDLHRIMCESKAWLLAAMWEGTLDDESECRMGHSDFWDRG